jgi:hypothetical protein
MKIHFLAKPIMQKLVMVKINMNEVIMAKPTAIKLLTMSEMNLVKINMNEIIMAKIKSV